MRPHDPLTRLRAANPVRSAPRDAVDHDRVLERASDVPPDRPSSRRRRARWPAALLAAMVALAGAGGALAASGVGLPWISGDPPLQGTIPSSIEVLPLRVADPAGGPPWALRAYRTDRGAACLEVGRISGRRFDRVANAIGCTRLPPRSQPAPAPFSGTGGATITLDGSPVASSDASTDAANLRTIAYGTPNGLNSAYLVVLPGDVPSHRLQAIEPCERRDGRLVAAVAGRCPG